MRTPNYEPVSLVFNVFYVFYISSRARDWRKTDLTVETGWHIRMVYRTVTTTIGSESVLKRETEGVSLGTLERPSPLVCPWTETRLVSGDPRTEIEPFVTKGKVGTERWGKSFHLWQYNPCTFSYRFDISYCSVTAGVLTLTPSDTNLPSLSEPLPVGLQSTMTKNWVTTHVKIRNKEQKNKKFIVYM